MSKTKPKSLLARIFFVFLAFCCSGLMALAQVKGRTPTGAEGQAGVQAVPEDINWDNRFYGYGLSNRVFALVMAGSDLYAGGDFTLAGVVAANHIAKWNGSFWSALGSGTSDRVDALAVIGTNIYAGGAFTQAGGTSVNHVAKWDGTSWSALGVGLSGEVLALAVIGTDLYAGGDFPGHIAKWNGTSWSTLGTGTNNTVYALSAIGTDLYVGGAFTQAGGTSANHIAKWNGTSWSALGTGAIGNVFALAAGGSDLYVGGDFATAGSVTVNHIAKWNGTSWSALGLGTNDYVAALAVSGTDLYAGGNFTTASALTVNYVAKWNGSTWSALGSGTNGLVDALAVPLEGLYVGGDFISAGSQPSLYIGLWHQDFYLTSPNGGESWEVGSSHTITWYSAASVTNVKIEYSADNGSTWATVVNSTPNDGSYPWTPIPNAASPYALVRISDTADGNPSDTSNAVFTIAGFKVTAPNGGEQWVVGSPQTITWKTAGTYPTVRIQLSTNNGGNWSSITSSTANTGSYPWTVAGAVSAQCLIRVGDSGDGVPSDASDAVFSIVPLPTITVTSPNGGEVWNVGSAHDITWTAAVAVTAVKIELSMDGGSNYSVIIASTPNDGVHPWTVPDTPSTTCLVRISQAGGGATDTSDATFTIAAGGGGGLNSPSNHIVLPECIWAPATGGGTWVSEVQVTDVSGGSNVSAYFSSGGGSRRGPITLWTNTGGDKRSVKFSNLLMYLGSVDSAFSYFGKVGAVEFVTQDANHLIQVGARTLNGNYAKTFPGLSLLADNLAAVSRPMLVPNLSNTTLYRSTCGFFNPTANTLRVEFRLFGGNGTTLASAFSKDFVGYDFQSFSPFSEAGIPYPSSAYDNVYLKVTPTSGTGSLVCFGASANNNSNDPAAHIAVQFGGTSANSPAADIVLPECIWAPATGGGTWVSEVQIIDLTGGAVVSAYFSYGGGLRQGPIPVWTNSGGAGRCVRFSNLLSTLQSLDSSFTYFGRVGAVEFLTQDAAHLIQVVARTVNGDYAKTFPGLAIVDPNTADTARQMIIQNYTNNSTYRSTCGFYNPTADPVTVEFRLYSEAGLIIGAPFTKNFVGYDFKAFSPFNEAGVPYPGASYDNVILLVRPTSGAGKIICFGASANNSSNDPAAHLALQYQ